MTVVDNNTPRVCVMVLNYNGQKFLKGCFDSLLACNYPNLELMMVDNKSTENDVEFVAKNYPQVKIVQTGKNAGYSRAYNIAFKNSDAKYFIMLNNDVKVDPHWVEPLVEAAEKDDSIAALQPKILSMIDDGFFEYAGASGGFIDKYGYTFLRGRVFFTVEEDKGQYDDVCELFWTSGAAMFVRASALQKSGDLDEDFVHHMEEVDLCWRINLAGFKLKVIPQSFIYHYEGATIKPQSFKKLYWNYRNNIFMMMKNYSAASLLKYLTVRYVLDAVNIFSLLFQLKISQMYAIIKAHFWILSHFGLILRKRKNVQKQRRISDKQLLKKVYQKSIVFKYFIEKKKTYSEIVG